MMAESESNITDDHHDIGEDTVLSESDSEDEGSSNGNAAAAELEAKAAVGR
jgi:hypothetical protein